MANVLIGIISITLFIGLSLAGAVFFGPILGSSSTDAGALSYLTAVSSTAGAATTMNRETQSVVQSRIPVSILIPDYLAQAPTLKNGNTVQLVDNAGAQTTNPAAFAAVSLGTDSSALEGCNFIENRVSGGTIAMPTLAAWPTGSQRGCFLAGAAIGPFAAGAYIAYAQI